MFVSKSTFWRMPFVFAGLQRAPRSTFKISHLLTPLILFLNADENRLAGLERGVSELRGWQNDWKNRPAPPAVGIGFVASKRDELVAFMFQKGIQRKHRELRYLKPLHKRLRNEVALFVDPEIEDDKTTEARVHKFIRHLNASRETIRWGKCDAAEYVKGYDEVFGKQIILPFTEKYVITEITESDTVRSPKAGFYHILRVLIRNGPLKLKRCKYRECSQFFVPENLKEKFCSIECRRTLDGKDAFRRVHDYRERVAKNKAKQKQALAAKQHLQEKDKLLAYLKSQDFNKRLSVVLSVRAKKQKQEIERLQKAPSVQEYARNCDPAIKRIITAYGPNALVISCDA